MTQLDMHSERSIPPEETHDPLKLPAVLITVGAASMVIAALTLIANFAGLLMAVGNATTAGRVPAYVARGTPARMPAVLNPTTTTDSQVPSPGINQSNRKFIVNKLSAMQKLRPTQTLELQYFLLLTGRSVFPSTTGTITDDDVKLQITGSGQHESTGPDDDAYTWFDTQNGKLKVFDASVYLDRGGSSPPVVSSYSLNATVASGPGFGPLGMTQIYAAIYQVKTMWPNPAPLNAAQEATLIQELKSPSQNIMPPVTNQYPVSTVLVDADGTTTIMFQGKGQIQINQQGTTLYKRSASYDPAAYRPPPIANMIQWATAFTLIDSFLSASLAILLLIAGIQTLRGSCSGSLLHRIFAWIKLPIAFFSVIAAVALAQEIGQNMGASTTLFDQPFSLVAPTIILVVALLSVAYPILLLIVFRHPKVRTFYRRVIWN